MLSHKRETGAVWWLCGKRVTGGGTVASLSNLCALFAERRVRAKIGAQVALAGSKLSPCGASVPSIMQLSGQGKEEISEGWGPTCTGKASSACGTCPGNGAAGRQTDLGSCP